MPNKKIEFKIAGKGVTPNSVPLSELLRLLGDFYSATHRTAKAIAPNSVKGAPLAISLSEIRDGSAIFELEAEPEAFSSARHVIAAIGGDSLLPIPLPLAARHRIEQLQSRLKPHNWQLYLTARDNGHSVTAAITPDTVLFADPAVKGATALLGYVVRVGGEPKRTAYLRLADKTHIAARVATRELTEKIGEHLYDYLQFEGEAEWYSSNWSLKSFRITGLGKYKESTSDPKQALKQLGKITGEFWGSVDVDNYLRDLRSE